MSNATPGRAALVATACAVALLSGDASPAETATRAVAAALARAREVSARDAEKAVKLERLRAIARELFDTRAMGRRTIGPILEEQNSGAQREFLDLFDEFIVRAYLQKLLFFRDPRFRFAGDEVLADATIVHTWIDTPKDSFEVDYRMVEQPDGWRASDVLVEGVSLGSNYAEQFQSILRDRDFEYLLEKMRRKVDRFRAKGDT